MSKDRSTSTDALETLGTLIDDSAGRDAIHLAVEPVTAGEDMAPGENVSINNGIAMISTGKKVGIVDPFLKNLIHKGEKFWLIVYPRQITSLRHVWSHPDFEEEVVKVSSKEEKAIQWLKNCANEIDESYEHVMEVADSHQSDSYGDYIVQGGRFEGESTPDEFWDYYAIVRHNSNPNRTSFFSCSC